MHRIRTAFLVLVMAATGVYFVLYLYGWEWYRAQIVGIVFVAAEVAAVGSYLGGRLRQAPPSSTTGSRTDHAGDGHRHDGHDVVAEVFATTQRTYPDTFRWLQRQSEQTSVFIPLLLGAGVAMSALAWLMERLAGALYGDRIDESLTSMAASLMPPADLLDTPTRQALLTTPGRWDDFRPGR